MTNNLFDRNFASATSYIFSEQMELKGKNLEDVAEGTSTKYNTLYRYFNGTRMFPLKLFIDVCKYLEMDFEETYRRVHKTSLEKTINEYS